MSDDLIERLRAMARRDHLSSLATRATHNKLVLKERSAILEEAAEALERPASPAEARYRAERIRQVVEEGYTHDRDRGRAHELLAAAAAYSAVADVLDEHNVKVSMAVQPPAIWPWAPEFWKSTTARRNREKAAALALAAIDAMSTTDDEMAAADDEWQEPSS